MGLQGQVSSGVHKWHHMSDRQSPTPGLVGPAAMARQRALAAAPDPPGHLLLSVP